MKRIFPVAILVMLSRVSYAFQLPLPAPARPTFNATVPGKPVTSAPVKPGAPGPAHAKTGSVPEDDTVVIVEPGDEAPAPRAGVGGVAIGGMTDYAAYQELQLVLGPQLGVPVQVNDGHKIWTMTRAALGLTIPYRELMQQAHKAQKNVPLRFKLDPTQTRVTLASLGARLDTIAAKEKLHATINVEASVMRVRAALEARPPHSQIALIVERVAVKEAAPQVLVGGKSPRADYPYLLAAFVTHFDSGIRGRTNNLRMAARNVDNTIVQDGAIFSANRAIGPRDAAAGWREAKMFVDGQVVSGIGSGICQCSSTLYNAALLAGFDIVERHPHMFRVNYVPVSRDAAIYWGQKDMKFRNNSGGPIWVRTYITGEHFHAEFWGMVPRTSQISVSSRIVSRKRGTHSQSFREITDASGTRKERLSNDYYMPHP